MGLVVRTGVMVGSLMTRACMDNRADRGKLSQRLGATPCISGEVSPGSHGYGKTGSDAESIWIDDAR